MDTPTKIGARIRAAREKNGSTLTSFATKLNVSKAHLSLIETGERIPSEKLLRAICRELELDVDSLVRLQGKVPRDVIRYVARTPGVLARLRAEMAA